MVDTITKRDIVGFSDTFKTRYGTYNDNLYGSGVEDPLEAKIQKTFGLDGKDFQFPIKLTFGGSVSFQSIPNTNHAKHTTMTMDSRAAYAAFKIGRKTIKASQSNEAAWKATLDYEVQCKIKSFNRVQAMKLYNDNTMILGQFDGSAGGTEAEPEVVILNTGNYRFRNKFFEEGDYVEIESTGTTLLTSLFSIEEVTPGTRTVKLKRISGADNLTTIGAGTHNIVLQKSSLLDADNDVDGIPYGIMGPARFTTGQTLYGAAFHRRLKPYYKQLAKPKLINISYLNEGISDIEFEYGETIDTIILSYKQYTKFINTEEVKKTYEATQIMGSSNSKSKVVASFSGITVLTESGPIQVARSRYLYDDAALLIKASKAERKHLEGFGWFDDDGTIILREPGRDAYGARYGGYYENFFNPTCVGLIEGFAV